MGLSHLVIPELKRSIKKALFASTLRQDFPVSTSRLSNIKIKNTKIETDVEISTIQLVNYVSI